MDEKSTMTLLNRQTGKLETFNIHTGELIVREGEAKNSFVYSLEMADAICNLIREGCTLNEISKYEGMPPLHVIYRWRSYHPDFAEKIKKAKLDRAEFYHDKAASILETASRATKDDVPAIKLQFDGYLKLAEKNNPEEYQAKPAQVAGAGTTVIMINTGINRRAITDGTKGIVEAESQSVGGQRISLGRIRGDSSSESEEEYREPEPLGAETSEE